ncbi:MAG: 3'-5' exonuclease [Nanoarchaeota archaeon]|nr:3'-5' exonuclease [Nanoarchaeota archaeon]MBU1005018.1 3'-5' exonuclease [Nanoarchaeota archaeon]MBU1945910.1 3'-5' exonuclease [Nanoarchaeota archaeon]
MVFTVIDIETTGLSKHYHKITEIAAAKVRNNKITKTYHTLVNPKVKIPSFITRLTGIDNEMVKEAPTINKALPSFVEFLGEDVFVAHNATFDFGFIEHNLKVHNSYRLDNSRLCTRKLANRLFPELSRKRLSDLCEFMNINNSDEHRALSDVKATAKIFANMLKLMKNRGIYTIEDILKFEKSNIRRNF